jgi:type I restriction enzyme S subunit
MAVASRQIQSRKWESRHLGECADWLSGGTPFKGNPSFWTGSIPWISAKDMKSFRLHDAEDHISDSAVGHGGKVVPAGTILLLVRGMTLHNDVPISVTMREMAFNQDIKAIRSKVGVDNLFLAYWLLAHKPDLLSAVDHAGHGTGRLLTDLLKKMVVALPSAAEQKAIAQILGALDEKIELNRQMNATLEAQARALFQGWFVDFSPVRAKFDGRKPASLDAATAALFPASFQNSRIGQIPKGWMVETFGDHTTAARGLSYKGEGLRDDGTGLPMHNLNSVYEGGGYKHEGIKFYAGEFREKHLVQPGDMIVTNTEQGFDHLLIGHAAIVPERHGAKGLFSHHIYRVRPKPESPFTPHYLVQLFNNPRWHYWISGFSNGTTINMLPPDAVEMPLLVVPPAELIKKFTAFAESIHAQVEKNITESHSLAKLRDTLLPKLLSGELSAAKIEEAAHA